MSIPITEAILIAEATIKLGNIVIKKFEECKQADVKTISHADLVELLALPKFESFLEKEND